MSTTSYKSSTNREEKRSVTLVIEGRFGIAFATTKQLQYETSKLVSDIIVRRTRREVGLGAQVQQKKSFWSRKHFLARLRFA